MRALRVTQAYSAPCSLIALHTCAFTHALSHMRFHTCAFTHALLTHALLPPHHTTPWAWKSASRNNESAALRIAPQATTAPPSLMPCNPHARPSHVKSSQVTSSPVKSRHVKSSHVTSRHVKSPLPTLMPRCDVTAGGDGCRAHMRCHGQWWRISCPYAMSRPVVAHVVPMDDGLPRR